MERIELYNDHFQNFKVYGIPHAQLIISKLLANNMEIDKIYNMDCLEGMKHIPDGSIDAIK